MGRSGPSGLMEACGAVARPGRSFRFCGVGLDPQVAPWTGWASRRRPGGEASQSVPSAWVGCARERSYRSSRAAARSKRPGTQRPARSTHRRSRDGSLGQGCPLGPREEAEMRSEGLRRGGAEERIRRDCGGTLVLVPAQTRRPRQRWPSRCSHVYHERCLASFERFSLGAACRCPVCRAVYTKTTLQLP